MQMQDRVGQQFGNYRLISLIGTGGYAEVYLAEHIFLANRRYAIKVLTGTTLKEDDQRKKFLDEARIVANLQLYNAHIVKIVDFGIQPDKPGVIDDGIPYLVMEYAPGGTLRDLYPYGTEVPLDKIVFYVNQVAEALQCAHDQNPPIVHRDIKPENMLLRDPDFVLLSDFGIAIEGQTGTQLKPSGIVVGTATYMAPECLSKRPRRASDQYSLAIVVYEWLSGDPPFEGTEQQICYQQLKERPQPLAIRYPHVTPEIEAVVIRALEKKPEDRFGTVREFAQALEDAVKMSQSAQQQTLLQTNQRAQRPITTPGSIATPPGVQQAAMNAQVPQAAQSIPTPNQQGKQQAHNSLNQQANTVDLRQGVNQQANHPATSSLNTIPSPQVPQQNPLVLPGSNQVQAGGANDMTFSSYPPPNQQLAQNPTLPQPTGQIRQPPLTPNFAVPPRYQSPQPAWSNAGPTPQMHQSSYAGGQSYTSRQNSFELSLYAATDPHFRLFRMSGILLNIIAAIAIGLLLTDAPLIERVLIVLVGLIWSLALFSLCIRMVNRALATFLGGLVALYWGVVGLVIGNFILSRADFSGSILTGIIAVIGFAFFLFSIAIHIRYVSNKNN